MTLEQAILKIKELQSIGYNSFKLYRDIEGWHVDKKVFYVDISGILP